MNQDNIPNQIDEGEVIPEFVGLSDDITKGSDHFWAKRGGDPGKMFNGRLQKRRQRDMSEMSG
ncbi:hypothetical protein [uncultured phage MedDCM-OCT-S12-C102]|nr:hypothetical protein [uncultured phage MedDCM-OCT-S12-C102]BAQ84357.1 hypothetical protein [uncultured Mediterranean phage uvMED]